MREYATLKALRRGEIVSVQGFRVRSLNRPLRVNDHYVGERNTGPKLLTCRAIHPIECWVYPAEAYAYAYDLHECEAVEVLDANA